MTAAEAAWWVALLGLAGSCAALGWWLLFSPLERSAPPGPRRRMDERVVSIAIGMYVVLGTAGIWDASWHMQYGIAGTIADFWSPPHLLMYASFGAIAGFTAFALVALLGGTGGFRERVRAQPLLAAFCLISLYQMGSGPLDELWHKVNGVDSTAWALPHFIIVVLAAAALALLGSLYQDAIVRRTRWTELVLLFPFAVILWTAMGVAIGDWEFTLVAKAVPEGNPLLGRPDWAYIVAGVIPGAAVLGAVAAVLDRRWATSAEAALMFAWSVAAFALFAVMGSSLPVWTTPTAYLSGALAVDLVRRARPLQARPLAAGVIFAAVETAVATALTVNVTRFIDLTTADVLVAVGIGVPVGAFAYAVGHAIGHVLRTLPDRVATGRIPSDVGAPASARTL